MPAGWRERRWEDIGKRTGKFPVSRETYHKTPRLPPPVPRLGRRHAPPSVQKNGTGSGATASDERHGTTRNALHAPIPTAGTTRIDGKRTKKREGSPQERHRRRPKGDVGTPADGENGGETARLAAREAGRETRRGMERRQN